MTWTYSGDPSSSSRDSIRFLIGDTDTNDPQITDEEIAYLSTQTSSNFYAAAMACMTIAAKFARKADKSVGDLSINFNALQDHYKNLAEELNRRGNLKSSKAIFVGGISISNKDTVEDNTDRVEPRFKRDQFSIDGDIEQDPQSSRYV